MSRICKVWEVVLAELRTQLTTEQYGNSEKNLHKAFETGAFDDQLYQMAVECPATINLQDIPDIAVLLQTHASEIEKALPQTE